MQQQKFLLLLTCCAALGMAYAILIEGIFCQLYQNLSVALKQAIAKMVQREINWKRKSSECLDKNYGRRKPEKHKAIKNRLFPRTAAAG
jgi:hypothetical protein